MISELHMWLTFGVIAGAMLLYVTELVAIEMTSLLALVVMLLLFTLFPQIGPDGTNLLDATALLAGFGNPALITVMALLVMAQGLFQSGALENLIDRATRRATTSRRTMAAAAGARCRGSASTTRATACGAATTARSSRTHAAAPRGGFHPQRHLVHLDVEGDASSKVY